MTIQFQDMAHGYYMYSSGTLNNTCTFDSINEREEFMQETQHTQQTATRTAQNQDKKTT